MMFSAMVKDRGGEMVVEKKNGGMVWNTYRANFTNKKIEIYNIFNHYSFDESVKKIIKKRLSREDLSVALRREVMYYFWSRCEYEVTIAPFPAYIENDRLEKMIDQREDFHDPLIVSDIIIGLQQEIV